ncbi:hypothetical protein C4D60_Mb01t04850 [Musa balbisiana]|uniref:Uncharacterized protein n=1 Tax=Musa balbisiana TaxID=52838 RepID=A0A4S8JK69_MUSBA|nr:hypothetical protein C4D60_Mb01t04850 [Musa balbisiana]
MPIWSKLVMASTPGLVSNTRFSSSMVRPGGCRTPGATVLAAAMATKKAGDRTGISEASERATDDAHPKRVRIGDVNLMHLWPQSYSQMSHTPALSISVDLLLLLFHCNGKIVFCFIVIFSSSFFFFFVFVFLLCYFS